MFSRKEKIFVALVILIFISGATIRVLKSRHIIGTHSKVVEFNLPQKNNRVESALFMVQVEGFVKNPGIYNIPAGSRVSDAIKLAGGVLSEGEERALNLVLPVIDGMRIYVPEKGAPLDDPDRYIDVGPVIEGTNNLSDIDIGLKVDINSASVEEFEHLPSIGKVLAGEIIKYREKVGRFNKIEELKNVKGIGETKFNEIREYITCR
ncbi:MAG: helix-hairpin-helix domain-containing protein [bacterium]